MKPLNSQILLVTTGDGDGIGFEVAAKALLKLPIGFFKTTHVFVFVPKGFEKKYLSQLKKNFAVEIHTRSTKDFFPLDYISGARSMRSKAKIFLIVASDTPADWIYNLARLCLHNSSEMALVTGPLSKTLIKESGYTAIGHTEILAEVASAPALFMGFVGKHFNVVLLTGHVPLRKVYSALKKIDWNKALAAVTSFTEGLGLSNKPMGLLGMNPHAGEKGMISAGEDEFLSRKIKFLSKRSSARIEGPLVPDAAFLKSNWNRYSVFLCSYHDQGLIPFKAIHGQDSGVHVTLGLPFVRTSVDHGTAKEIFGLNKANPNSMKEALVLAKKLLKLKSN